MSRAPAGALGLLVAVPMASRAVTIRVPAELPTIQAGIDAATATDTVLVAPGTYSGPGNRDLHFDGQSRILLSEQVGGRDGDRCGARRSRFTGNSATEEAGGCRAAVGDDRDDPDEADEADAARQATKSLYLR